MLQMKYQQTSMLHDKAEHAFIHHKTYRNLPLEKAVDRCGPERKKKHCLSKECFYDIMFQTY